MIDLRQLQLRRGQRLNGRTFPPLWRKLLLAIAERTPKRLSNARQRRGPDGVSIIAGGRGGGGYVVHPWQMSVNARSGESGNVYEVTFQRGLINGVEGKIDTGVGLRAMSDADDAGDLPALTVSDFDERGIARIYAEVTFHGFAWFTQSVELIASAKVPDRKAFTAHKLIGILVKERINGQPTGDALPEPRAFFDLSLLPIDTTKDGAATYLSSPAA